MAAKKPAIKLAQKLFYVRQFYLGSPGFMSEVLAAGESWQPGLLHPNLSWTHYRTLLKAERRGERDFYEPTVARTKRSGFREIGANVVGGPRNTLRFFRATSHVGRQFFANGIAIAANFDLSAKSHAPRDQFTPGMHAGIPPCCLMQIPRRCLGNPTSSPRLVKFPSLSAGSGTHER